MPVKVGDRVKVEYTATVDNGDVVMSSETEGLLEVTIGTYEINQSLEEELVGLEEGDEKSFTVPAKHAFGEVVDTMIRDVPKKDFPSTDEELQVGMFFVMQAPGFGELPCTIREITEETLKLDFNHPLAGKDVTFNVKLVENMGHDDKFEERKARAAMTSGCVQCQAEACSCTDHKDDGDSKSGCSDEHCSCSGGHDNDKDESKDDGKDNRDDSKDISKDISKDVSKDDSKDNNDNQDNGVIS